MLHTMHTLRDNLISEYTCALFSEQHIFIILNSLLFEIGLKIQEKSPVSGVLNKPQTRFKTIYRGDSNSAAPSSKAISNFGMFQNVSSFPPNINSLSSNGALQVGNMKIQNRHEHTLAAQSVRREFFLMLLISEAACSKFM